MAGEVPFAAGDACLLYDEKGRRYLIELIPGRDFHYHHGVLAHDDIVGSRNGTTFRSSRGAELVAMRPRLADYVLKMGRGPTVVYPKDAGPILMWADIGPGMTVVEAGTGSGGLTMVLARAVLPGGAVISVERRADHSAGARRRIEGFFRSGLELGHVSFRVGSVEEVIAESKPDRVVLDVPEPWHSVGPAAERLPGGGVFCCYLPTVPQVQAVREAIAATGRFIEVDTFEVLHREWAVDGRSVRPEHRMVGHTGFITVGRKRLRSGES
jgi:tRNA (adenine57-N1/adenine58-N1)-methyltransferase